MTEIQLNAIRYRSDELQKLRGEPGRLLALDDVRWLLRYIDKLKQQHG